MGDTSIEWTDKSWNPVRGCTRVSPECLNCYAERQAYRFSKEPGSPYQGLVKITNGHPQWTGATAFVKEHLLDPLKWKDPKKIFVNSMSDLFHDGITDQEITDVVGIMALAHWHTFQVLTKRPKRMLKYLSAGCHGVIDQFKQIQNGGGIGPKLMFRAIDRGRRDEKFWQWPLPNVIWGVSVGMPKYKSRIDLLRETPAAVRMLSLEPLLEDLGPLDLRGIHWVIVGGESGPGARPMHPGWPRSIRDQCVAAGVPFFFKQWGCWRPTDAKPISGKYTGGGLFLKPDGSCGNQGDWWDGNAAAIDKLPKKAAGRLLDGKEWSQYPDIRR